jgi:N-acylneuraminate cytidylyltransferase
MPFFGRPIVAYTIEAALASALFERTVVSTDDGEIASIAVRYGAIADSRPAHLADDAASIVDVCLEYLDREAAAGRTYDAICVLYATSPLRTADHIKATMDLLRPGRHDFALGVTEYDLPPYRALKIGADGELTPMWYDFVYRNSQDVPPLVVNNASTYAVTVDALRAHKTFTGPGAVGYRMPRSVTTDIDTAEDFDEAVRKAERLGWTRAPADTRSGARE